MWNDLIFWASSSKEPYNWQKSPIIKLLIWVSSSHMRLSIFTSYVKWVCCSVLPSWRHCNTLQHTATHCNTLKWSDFRSIFVRCVLFFSHRDFSITWKIWKICHNHNIIGLFPTERGKRDLENKIIDCDLHTHLSHTHTCPTHTLVSHRVAMNVWPSNQPRQSVSWVMHPFHAFHLIYKSS